MAMDQKEFHDSVITGVAQAKEARIDKQPIGHDCVFERWRLHVETILEQMGNFFGNGFKDAIAKSAAEKTVELLREEGFLSAHKKQLPFGLPALTPGQIRVIIIVGAIALQTLFNHISGKRVEKAEILREIHYALGLSSNQVSQAHK